MSRVSSLRSCTVRIVNAPPIILTAATSIAARQPSRHESGSACPRPAECWRNHLRDRVGKAPDRHELSRRAFRQEIAGECPVDCAERPIANSECDRHDNCKGWCPSKCERDHCDSAECTGNVNNTLLLPRSAMIPAGKVPSSAPPIVATCMKVRMLE